MSAARRLARLLPVLFPLAAAASPPALPEGLASPDGRIVCSEAEGACYDRFGASIGFTQAFLGTDAADRLVATLRGRPPEKTFAPAPGITCIRETGPCRAGDEVVAGLTKLLYGSVPAPRQNE